MSETVPGVGRLSDVPRPAENPRFEGLQLSPEDWFLLSRIDGQTSLRDLFTLSSTGRPETIASLQRLAAHALIELPAAAPEEAAAPPPAREPELVEPPQGWPTRYEDFVVEPALVAEAVPLGEALRKLLLYYHAHLTRVSYYELLGVARDASAGEIKRAYFRLSKQFHPDRFFRQELGSFGPRLSEVFRWLNEAHKTLASTARRAEYDALLARGLVGPWQLDRAGSPEASAPPPAPPTGLAAPPSLTGRPLAELLGEAKRLERAESFREAVLHYEAALAQRESAELMNRIAECLIRTRSDLDHAERRARGAIALAPQTARYHVALAFILEQQGLTGAAVASYRQALELDPTHQAARTRLERLLES